MTNEAEGVDRTGPPIKGLGVRYKVPVRWRLVAAPFFECDGTLVEDDWVEVWFRDPSLSMCGRPRLVKLPYWLCRILFERMPEVADDFAQAGVQNDL